MFGAVAGDVTAHATHPDWWILAALGLAIATLAWVTTTTWAHETARRTADSGGESPGTWDRVPSPDR